MNVRLVLNAKCQQKRCKVAKKTIFLKSNSCRKILLMAAFLIYHSSEPKTAYISLKLDCIVRLQKRNKETEIKYLARPV